MTQKELLYLEDAVNHEKSIIQILKETKKKLEDENLINYAENEILLHEETEENLLNLMEVKASE
ncbi:MAG: hypothetical protein IKD77_01655 [Bacilli bacterium]|nr:hypothetical protein [Bacilli bacterium]